VSGLAIQGHNLEGDLEAAGSRGLPDLAEAAPTERPYQAIPGHRFGTCFEAFAARGQEIGLRVGQGTGLRAGRLPGWTAGLGRGASWRGGRQGRFLRGGGRRRGGSCRFFRRPGGRPIFGRWQRHGTPWSWDGETSRLQLSQTRATDQAAARRVYTRAAR